MFWKKTSTDEQASIMKKAEQESVIIQTKQKNTQLQLQLMGLTKKDLQVVKHVRPIVEQHIDEMTTTFYEEILKIDHLKQIIVEKSSVERLRKTLRTHILEMFNGKIDDVYFEKRLKIARVHNYVGLESQWYLSSFQTLFNTFISIIQDEIQHPADKELVIHAVSKMFSLEQQIVVSAYEERKVDEIKTYQKKQEETTEHIIATGQALIAATEETSRSIENVVKSKDEVSKLVRDSESELKETQQLAISGEEKLNALETQLFNVSNNLVEMQEVLSELHRSSEDIQSIVQIVQDIANQTNMLSLNASIEAARAGHEGHGFAVVASEVRKLSDQTAQSVEEIKVLIGKSRSFTASVTESIQHIEASVDNGSSHFMSTKSAFEDIVRAMEQNIGNINKMVQEINALATGIDDISAASDTVNRSANLLSAASDQVD